MVGLGGWTSYLIAVVPLVMGLHLIGWLRLPIPAFARIEGRRGVSGAFITGLLLSLVLAPCGTPLLASVLAYAAYKGNVAYDGLLLFLYGLGAGLPVLLIGTTAGRVAARLDANGHRLVVDRATGAMLLALGFYLLWSS
jgi:cytochrome c biogenesis protein CcdA